MIVIKAFIGIVIAKFCLVLLYDIKFCIYIFNVEIGYNLFHSSQCQKTKDPWDKRQISIQWPYSAVHAKISTSAIKLGFNKANILRKSRKIIAKG